MQLCDLQQELDHIYVAFGSSVRGGGGQATEHGDHVGDFGDVWGHWVVLLN